MPNNLTLLDHAKRMDPRGNVARIAELLTQTNEMLMDLVSMEGNLPTGHRTTIQVGLPTIYYRSINEGIPTSRGSTVQVDEGVAIAEARSEVDLDLAMLNGNTAAFRFTEARMFLEAMNQKIATGMVYGNPANDPAEFLGFAPRYSDFNAGNGQNIIDAGGRDALEQTSVWLVCWGDNTIFCPYPKGSQAGILQEDLGRQTAFEYGSPSFNGRRMEVLAERFQWKIGLCVKDWRAAVRIANIETNDFAGLSNELNPKATTPPYQDLLHLMAKAVSRIPKNVRSISRPAFYMNASVFSVLMRTALEKSNAALSIQTALSQFGTPYQMLSFLGIPIRQMDAIVNTEAVITP